MPEATTAIAGAAIGANLIGGVLGQKDAKKARAQEQSAIDRQLAIIEDQDRRYQELVDKIPAESKDMIDRLNKAYAESNLMLEQAKLAEDDKAVKLFESQRALVQSHLASELEAIGQNSKEFTGLIDELSGKALELINSDEDANAELKNAYKKESDAALTNLNKMADLSEKRLGDVLKTGLPPGAAAVISKVQQGVTDLKRKTMDFESKLGKGGSASRVSAIELEGLKMIGETTANLQMQGNELISQGIQQIAGLAGEAENLSARRMQGLQETRGRNTLAALQPYQEAKLAGKQAEGAQSLTAMGNANTETRRLTGAEGDASLARENQYARDRMSLFSGKVAGEQDVQERGQDLAFTGQAQSARIASSMADIFGAQAQNYANMNKELRASSMGLFQTAAMAGAGGVMSGGMPGTTGFDATKFGQGAMLGGYGVDLRPRTSMFAPVGTTGTSGTMGSVSVAGTARR